MAPRGIVEPDFLNLGVAPPAPQGALRFAPRLKFVPQFTLGDPFIKIPRPSNPLVLGFYLLPASGAVQGWPFVSPFTNGLLPNPYDSET